MDFIHLHNHSDYSILDGGMTVDNMITRAIELGMPAIALTDHGNMFGAIDFYQRAKKKGIIPIVGQEFYMAPGSRFKKEIDRTGGDETAYHLVLLAENEEGYRNLMKLSSIGFTEGFYYKPRIDMEVLSQHSKGLICSSACIGGQIPVLILRGKYKEARELAGKFSELFGKDRFYLELQYHGIPEQETANRELVKMSGEMNLPLIVTNDAHYSRREDASSHDALLCIQTGKTLHDQDRMKFSSDQFYLKSAEEMRVNFADYPDALYNTCKIAEMTDLNIPLGKAFLPHFNVPEGFNLDTFLRHLVDEGAHRIYGERLPDEVLKRIEYELSVIYKMQFSGYFLIVWDFINYARSVQIPVGPGRGSAAGSIISYCLGITALDPLRYNLLFERFLNPDRNEMPDMDLDFCAERREEVIDYVKRKYGEDRVSQIITFNKMKAKAVIKDVARVMDIPFSQANEISKLIQEGTLKEALASSKEFKELSKDPQGKELVETSLKLEGFVRSAGKHAAGVVISPGPLTDFVPLYKDPKEGSIVSQYEKNTLEQAGLVKMDFLGLKNLTIIDKCVKLIKKTRGIDVDITTIPLDDQATFDLLQRADTRGVFQLESGGMQNILRRLGPTTFDDIIAIVALYRPGPLGSGMVEDFIKRKRNPKLVAYPHPYLEPILKDTLGVVVYQEQVMLISQVMAGFTLPEADKLRKAMGKKKIDIINELEGKFLKGAEQKKIDRSIAESLYSMIKKFGEYGFNKSHSAAYALVTYQTAYLKAHYCIEYMATLLSAQPDKQDDVIQYINDCKASGIAVFPPSICHSYCDFTIERGSIRFGLAAIKGLGEKAIEAIVGAREEVGGYATLREFLESVDLVTVNKGVLEALIMSGSLDELHPNRAQLFASVERMIEIVRKLQEDKASGQGNLFGMGGAAETSSEVTLDLPDMKDWPDNEKLANERTVLGLYLSGHPLAKFEKDIRQFSSMTIAELLDSSQAREVNLVGVFGNVQVRRSQKSGKPYAIATFEDLGGSIDAMIFSKLLDANQALITSGQPVMINGSVEAEGEGQRKIIVQGIKSLTQARREAISALHIMIDPVGVDDSLLTELKEIISHHRGSCPVFFHVDVQRNEKIIRAHSTFNIQPSEKLLQDLTRVVGQEAIRFSIGNH